MKRFSTVSKAVLIVALLTVLVFGTVAWAGKGGGKGKKPPACPNWDLICPDVWDPVVCDDGEVYSNQCYADRVCATGCESTGGGPVPL
jgi:hypothetical protein